MTDQDIQLLKEESNQRIYLHLGDRIVKCTFMWFHRRFNQDGIEVATPYGSLLFIPQKEYAKLGLTGFDHNAINLN